MRHRWLAAILLIAIALSATPATAEVVEIDPAKPTIVLDETETQKLTTLEGAAFASFASEISPDDTTVLYVLYRPDADDPEFMFLNINDGSTRSMGDVLANLPLFSELRWRDAQTIVYLSIERRVGPVIVALDRDTGAVSTQPIKVPAFPLSLSPNGSRLLMARAQDTVDQPPDLSPFQISVRQTPPDRVGMARFDAEPMALQLAEKGVDLSVLDLNSGEIIPLLTMPEGSGLVSAPAWTPDGSKLAFIHTTLPKISRSGTELLEKTTQDTLGSLPPAENPFLQGNVVDVFDFPNHDLRPNALQAKDGNGDIFGRVSWSTDGQTLLTQMQHPSQPKGRAHPIYLFPDRSYVRFYNASLQLIGTFDGAAVGAPSLAMPQFVSPDEVIFNAPYGLSYRLYYYNRVSGEFRQLSIWDGTYYQVRASRLSRQLVFSFSSFQRPPDLYRISWEGTALVQLTWHNTEIAAQSHVRADPVTFKLRNGAQRTGYIVQPAAAPFPPHNVPIVVWQEGGPGFAMTNEWGGNVEKPFNLLPNFGIALLVLPLPGREGFGPQFYTALADDRNFGAIDIDEAAQAVAQMIQRGYTSPGQVGITGCSYGGYFTSQSITRYPTLYAAANSQCTLLDLFHEWQVGFTPLVSYLEGRPPTTDPGEYIRDSPIYNTTKIRTPLLIFDGTFDYLPVTISANFHDQIAVNKPSSPVKFLKFKNEGHGLSLKNSQITAGQAQLAWFRQYLAAAKP